MENLNYIINPNTGEHINIYSINGLEILNKFVNHYKGGAEPNTKEVDNSNQSVSRFISEKETETIKIEYVVATKVEEGSFDKDKIGTAIIAEE